MSRWVVLCKHREQRVHNLQRRVLLRVEWRLVLCHLSYVSGRQVLWSVCGNYMLNLWDWQVLDRNRLHLRHMFILQCWYILSCYRSKY